MFKRFLVVLGVVACLVSSQAMAATVTYSVVETGPGTFDLLADVSQGDNFGLSVYGVPLTGPITSLDHNSPNTAFAQDGAFVGGPAGFTTIRSADGVLTVVGSQQLAPTPTPHVIGGFGQAASSFAAEGLTPLAPAEQPAWNASLLLASGTFDGLFSELGANTQSGDFAAAVFLDELLENSRAADGVDVQFIPAVPEPATMVLMGSTLLGLMVVRRRK